MQPKQRFSGAACRAGTINKLLSGKANTTDTETAASHIQWLAAVSVSGSRVLAGLQIGVRGDAVAHLAIVEFFIGDHVKVKEVCRRDHHGNAEVGLSHQDNAPRDKYDAEYIDKLRAECFDPPNKK